VASLAVALERCEVGFGPVRGLVNSAGIGRDVASFKRASTPGISSMPMAVPQRRWQSRCRRIFAGPALAVDRNGHPHSIENKRIFLEVIENATYINIP
jgi:hypothetical protein